mgnify:CR=1 FL=1
MTSYSTIPALFMAATLPLLAGCNDAGSGGTTSVNEIPTGEDTGEVDTLTNAPEPALGAYSSGSPASKYEVVMMVDEFDNVTIYSEAGSASQGGYAFEGEFEGNFSLDGSGDQDPKVVGQGYGAAEGMTVLDLNPIDGGYELETPHGSYRTLYQQTYHDPSDRITDFGGQWYGRNGDYLLTITPADMDSSRQAGFRIQSTDGVCDLDGSMTDVSSLHKDSPVWSFTVTQGGSPQCIIKGADLHYTLTGSIAVGSPLGTDHPERELILLAKAPDKDNPDKDIFFQLRFTLAR